MRRILQVYFGTKELKVLDPMENIQMIELAHGGGGRLARSLVRDEILSRFGDGPLRNLPDAAVLASLKGKAVFTTDSYVVQPLEFPGGDIGKLAVHGSVNDVAVCGAKPLWLSVAIIVEEGLPLATFRRVLDSIRAAADDSGVTVVTGDTKVVPHGQADGLYITTACVGELIEGFNLDVSLIRPGDAILVSGTIGDHGMAVMAARHHLFTKDGPESDTAPVHRLIAEIAPFAKDVHFMRDPTRGGLSAVLNEIVDDRSVDVILRETEIPISPPVRSASDILGIDPLHSACEGRIVLFCAQSVADAVLSAWKRLPEGRHSSRIGTVVEGRGRVIMETSAGGRRLVDLPRGELLPRIC